MPSCEVRFTKPQLAKFSFKVCRFFYKTFRTACFCKQTKKAVSFKTF